MSSSEVAFFSLSPQDIHAVRESNAPVDKTLLHLLEHSERLLATILIGNNVVNIVLILLSNYTLSILVDFGEANALRFTLQTIGLTFIILLFGEIFPKVWVRQRPLLFSRFSAPIIKVFYKLFASSAKALVRAGNRINKGERKGYDISVNDLSKAVELTEGKSPEQSEIMEGIIKFCDKTAEEIMVPRIDMEDIDCNWSFSRVLELIVNAGFSRLPVYEGTEDNIKGILYIKDCIPFIDKGDDFNWQSLIRNAYFVPENKMLDDLLEEFRSEHIHIAIVVDEYGGTSGLITLEDILEEIVGDISDEYDEEELPYIRLADGSYLFVAKTPITDFCRLLRLDGDIFESIDQEVDTIGGIFLEMRQEIPHVGDVVTYKDFRLEVTAMEKLRIQELKVTLPKTLRKGEPQKPSEATSSVEAGKITPPADEKGKA